MRPAAALLTLILLGGCAATDESDPRRSGSAVDRVSPVRAAELNTRLGVGYLERGQLQVALQKLEQAVEQDPEHVPAHLALGIVYQRIDATDSALQHLRTAVRLAPEDGGAHNSYAALLCEVGRYDAADRHFQAALEDPFYATPGVALANAGACARRDGRLDAAERYLREALRYDAQNRTALFNLAVAARHHGLEPSVLPESAVCATVTTGLAHDVINRMRRYQIGGWPQGGGRPPAVRCLRPKKRRREKGGRCPGKIKAASTGAASARAPG